MSENAENEYTQKVQLKVVVDLLEESGKKAPSARAYAFSAGGHLLTSKTLNADGEATLSFPVAQEARAVQVLIGPDMDEESVRVPDLQRRGAKEQSVRIDPQNLNPSVELAISPDIWRCWILGLCFVQGTLLKRIESGGVPIDLPVCNATVEIYEVEAIWIILRRLPDEIIEKMRQVVLNPPPPPPPDGPFVSGQNLAGMGIRQAFMRPEVSLATAAGETVRSATVDAAPKALSSASDLRFLAQMTSTFQFRQALLDFPDLVHYILCLIEPILVFTELVATAATDDCGHFETFFFKGCNNPNNPNLYFIAKQQIIPLPFFPPFVIYEPTPIPCYTYWNYSCGTEVTLYTTNPLAFTCLPCTPIVATDNWVTILSIGHYPLSLIYGTSPSLPIANPPTSDPNLGLTQDGAPWGDLLLPHIEFDDSLRANLGVQYYQVSYRRGTTGQFIPLTGDVHRHYWQIVNGMPVFEPYTLGPQTVNGVPNLFEIPPAFPPVGQWIITDQVQDTASAQFTTNTIDIAPGGMYPNSHLDQPDTCQFTPSSDTSGLYQLQLELFDASGHSVDINAPGKVIKYCIPTSTDLSGTVYTINADDPSIANLGLVSGSNFIMTLHIDNNKCCASVEAPTVNAAQADDNCGVLDYTNSGDMATLPYTAFHPHGFATYDFTLVRGINQLTPPSVAGQSVGSGNFAPTQSVSSLLGKCSVAGFAESLEVRAMATNGWSTLSGNDASAIRAFVLSPQ
jgi:hypothetical protein